MMRIKSREEIALQFYLNKADIAKLWQLSFVKASKVYNLAKEIDDKELKYHPEETKVRMTSVCKVMGVSLRVLKEQIGLKKKMDGEGGYVAV